jgi:hypothetical protein
VSSSIATYADDTKLFKEINCLDDTTALQDDLLNFETSSSNAGLQLNTSKCKALRVTRRRKTIEHPYSLVNQTLETSKHERDLGVWISNNLTWRKQVLEQCSKANKLLGFIKRSTRNITCQSAHRTLYLTLVRSQVGYATQVWEYLQEDLSRVAKCCSELHLLINPEKTKFLLIGTRQQLQNLPTDMCLNFLGETIRPVPSAKDLGLIRDTNMS